MKWVTFRDPLGDERVGVLDGDHVAVLGERLGLADLLARGADLEALGQALLADGSATRWGRDLVRLRSPIPVPPSVRDCLSYLDHIRNARRTRGILDELPPVWWQVPAFYFANPASVVGVDEPVTVPRECTRFDFELEIAVVIGRAGGDIPAADAMDHVAGYTLYCDWSARDAQQRERELGVGQGKGKDAATTLGPWLVTREEMRPLERADGLEIEVSATVNDRLLTSSPARGMQWSFADLIAHTSADTTLRPGDVIGSGTVPLACLLEHSAAPDFPGWLNPGDTVVLEAGVLGVIQQVVSARTTDTGRAT